MWQDITEGGHGAGLLHIGRSNGRLTKVVGIELKEGGELDHFTFTMFPTFAGKESYLNVRSGELFEDADPDRAGYVFARYEFSDDGALSVYYMSAEPFIGAVQEGRLKGELTYREPAQSGGRQQGDAAATDRKVECLRITDTPKNILEFIRSGEANVLFSEGIKLRKVDIPGR